MFSRNPRAKLFIERHDWICFVGWLALSLEEKLVVRSLTKTRSIRRIQNNKLAGIVIDTGTMMIRVNCIGKQSIHYWSSVALLILFRCSKINKSIQFWTNLI